MFVARPFEGLPGERDIVALRELVPAATAPLTVRDAGDREVLLCTLLPTAAPAMVRDTGAIWLGLQVQHSFGDPSRDLGRGAGQGPRRRARHRRADRPARPRPPPPGPGLGGRPWRSPSTRASASGSPTWRTRHPTSPLPSSRPTAPPRPAPGSPAWTRRTGPTSAPRSICAGCFPSPRRRPLDALARLHAAGRDQLVPDSRLVGMFRAHGLLVPVWDLAVGTGAEPSRSPPPPSGPPSTRRSPTPRRCRPRSARPAAASQTGRSPSAERTVPSHPGDSQPKRAPTVVQASTMS